MNPQQNITNPLKVELPGEHTICEIKRHPIGLVGIYLMSGFLLLALAVIAFVVVPKVFTEYSRTTILSYGFIAYAVIAFIIVGFLLIASKVYWGNRWVLSTDSITEITQTSLFNKQSSQLSLDSLEDVTAEQNGILTHIFNYGVIRVETAGERSNFTFIYCPNPNYHAQTVIEAREKFEQAGSYRGEREPAPAPVAPQAPLPPAAPVV